MGRCRPLFEYLRLAAVVGLVACGGEPPRSSEPLSSRVGLAAGNVRVKQGNRPWTRAFAGLMLRQGARLRVGPGDRALVHLDDGSAAFLRHGTEVELRVGGLALSKGEVWIDAPSREGSSPVDYRAGEVIVSAAGAGLDIKRVGGAVEVYVARGLAVIAAPGGRAEVQAGQRAVIRGKLRPRLSPVEFWEDWTGGMADRRIEPGLGGAGSGRIYAIDRRRPGSPPRALMIQSQQVRVVIRDGVARTTVDQRFANPGGQTVEGYYWFTVPDGAAVDRFALEVQGKLVEGEVIERKHAAAAYEEAIRGPVDPALLEWVDGRTFRARIFPIGANSQRRVVLSYMELLPAVDGKLQYVYPMGSSGARIQEFGLEVDLGAAGKKMQLATTSAARIERGGERVSVRRSGFRPGGDFLLEMKLPATRALRAVRIAREKDEAAYVMLRYIPDLDWRAVRQTRGRVVVVVDTSAGGDDPDRQLKADVAAAILRALSTGDRFALVTADLEPRVIFPERGMAPADEANVSAALDRLSGVQRGGATDLGAVFSAALERLRGGVQPAVVYIGDGRPTVGAISGDQLARRIVRSMAGSPARLFTIGVGAGADHGLLTRLARLGGGRAARVDLPGQAVQAALRFVGSYKTPAITDLRMDVGAGLDQQFSSVNGKVTRGQEVILLARTHHALPGTVTVTGKLGGAPFSRKYEISPSSGREHSYVPRLWARRYLARLLGGDRDSNRGAIINLGVTHSLMTPFTSFLVLESDAAYRRFGIERRPRRDLWGIQAKRVKQKIKKPRALKQDEIPDWLKKRRSAAAPGQGQRHRGTEGKMGSRPSRTRTGLYGLRGPPRNQDPHLARRLADDAARSAGVLGLLRTRDAPGIGGLGLASIFGRDTAMGRSVEHPLVRQPTPRVVAARLRVRGTLHPDLVRRIIRRHLNEVKTCAASALPARPRLSGRLTIQFEISAAGRVPRSSVRSSTLGHEPAGTCVAQAARRWLFPRPRNGQVVAVTVRFDVSAPPAPADRGVRPLAAETAGPPAAAPGICSDAAPRRLSHKMAIWRRRLSAARGAGGGIRVYRDASSACELTSWRERRTLLELVQRRVTRPRQARLLLSSLPLGRDRKHVRRLLLRRAVSEALSRAVVRTDSVSWEAADAALARLKTARTRVAALRKLCRKHPASQACVLRLVTALAEDGQVGAARAVGLKARRAALTTPALLEQLGDLLVAAGKASLAKRVYSEIVEYAPARPGARRRLGDIYLRHGWYEEAYRQYRTLTELRPDDALARLRLAAAAAGAGRVDEALRLERAVASADGEPGPADPRRWARLLSAARIARLLLSTSSGSETLRQSLLRRLRRLQVLTTPGVLTVITWEDHRQPLTLARRSTRGRPWMDQLDGAPAGLLALTGSPARAAGLPIQLRRASQASGAVSRPAAFRVTAIRFDGQNMTVSSQRGEVRRKPRELMVKIPAPPTRAVALKRRSTLQNHQL